MPDALPAAMTKLCTQFSVVNMEEKSIGDKYWQYFYCRPTGTGMAHTFTRRY